MTTTIGIDPGLTGAIARVGPLGAAVWNVPTSPHPSGKGKQIDYRALWDVVRLATRFGPPKAVYLERVHSMPNQGVASMFKFGEGYGAIQQALAASGNDWVLVRPQDWKKEFGLIKADKAASLEVAANLWPGLDLPGNKQQRIGCADALLIAEHGRRLRG